MISLSICVYIYIYIYICMYVCMYVCIYIYIYIPLGAAPALRGRPPAAAAAPRVCYDILQYDMI